MLQNIHDKAKGWVAYLIVGLIAVPFTLFGISSYLGGGKSLVAATVNGEEIPIQEVQNSVVQQRQRLAQIFGGKLPAGFNDATLKQQALEQVVNKTLLRQEAQTNGYRASNQEVYDTISNIPAFQVNGKFDPKTYDRLLTAQRRNKASFEAEIRESLSNQQFIQAMNQSVFIPKAENERYQRLQNQTRDIETYTLKRSDYKNDVAVTEDEIKKYYDTNADKFLTTEKVKLSYVALKQADLEGKVEVDDDALNAFYEENADRYTTPEQRKLAHILIKVDNKLGADAEKAAKKRVDRIYQQISSGTKTFEALASSDSDDSFSAKNAGDMGSLVRGDMGPSFEKVAFSLKKGDVSKPTKTGAGFEIIKVLDIVPATQKTFAQVKSAVEKAYRAEQAEKVFLDSIDKLQTLAFENESSLDEAADAVGLKVETSDWLEKSASSNKGIFASSKLINAAFSDDVLKQGKNSDLIEINDSSVAVVRIREHREPVQKKMEDVKEEIKAILVSQKLRKLLIDKGEKALAELKKNANWESVVSTLGGSINDVKKIAALSRTSQKVPPIVRDKAFSMQKPSNGKETFDNAILAEGDYVLIGLTAVKDGDVSNATTGFAQALGSREQTAVLKALREQADVQLFPENIQ